MFKLMIAASIALSGAVAHASADGLWTELTFEQAKAKAAEEDRILLAYATASWCPPCKQMERTTWVDESVAKWFKEHGIAFKFDVDENRELAKQLGIRAMPTLLAYREGELFDSVVGGRSAEQLLTWLNGVKDGRSERQRLQEAAGKRVDDDGRVDVQERMRIARSLVDERDFERATEEYLWLWDNMLEHQASMSAVRRSFLISDMQRLAHRHAPAMDAFRHRRDAYWPAMESGEADREQVLDWINLAKVVSDEDSVMLWFDAARDDPKMRPLLPLAGHEMIDRLIAAQRWRDLALLYPDPIGFARRSVAALAVIEAKEDAPFPEDMKKTLYRSARTNISYIYAAMLATGKEEAAADVAGVLLDADDSADARQALVSIALRANQLRQIHLQLLDEALEMGAHVRQLRREVAQALADSHT